ncbi:MAG: hypothetical protein ACYSX1_11210, partial [Planctomycetota bacterium]
GEQQAFKAVGSIASGILNKVIQAQENEQVSTFEGAYNAEIVKFDDLVRANPGAPEQDVRSWMQQANANITKAGAVPTNRNAQRRVQNTIRRNLPVFNARMEADWSAIESKRLFDNLKDDIEIATRKMDRDEVKRLVAEAPNGLIDDKQKENIIELANLRIDALDESARKQEAAETQRVAIDGVVDRINALKHKDREEALRNLEGLENADRNEIRARVQRQMESEMEAAELEARGFLLRETKGADGTMKADPDISGAKAIINSHLDDFGPDWHKAALANAQGVASDLNETGINPYTTTQNWPRYYEDEDLAFEGKLSLPDIQKHTGRNGYSDTEASRLKAIIKDPVAESDPTLKDALAEVEDFANIQRAALGDLKDLEDEEFVEERALLREARAKILRETNELKHALRQIKIQNPDITPGQYNDAINAILNPAKEDAVREEVLKWWQKSPFHRVPQFELTPEKEVTSEPLPETYVIPTSELLFYREKMNEISRQQLIQLIKEGDPDKLKKAHKLMKDTYGVVR